MNEQLQRINVYRCETYYRKQDAFERFPFMRLNQVTILKSLFWQIQTFPITTVAKAIVGYL